MANDESLVFEDICFNSTAMAFDHNEDCVLPDDLYNIDIPDDFDSILNPFDSFLWDDSGEEEKISIDQLLSNSSFDITQNNTNSQQQHIVPSTSPPIDVKYPVNVSLSFLNPPEATYHVRYLSEITNSPLNGNVVNTRIKTKKNISGRYLKGIRGRFITISLPSNLSDNHNLFIRVTRLTVPYQDISFVHPYPLLYAYPKKKMHSYVIIQGSSIYYKINKDEICSHSKYFPNIILTRLKQCQLKQTHNLYSFDDNETPYPFSGNNAKNKIAIYQLKKSQLDFRLVIKCEKTGEFLNTNIFCRSNALLEEEGVESKRSTT